MAHRSTKSPGAFAVRALQIPEDFVRGSILVSLYGRHRIRVENFRGIASCTDTEIRIIAGPGRMVLHGMHLQIERYTREEIEITGLLTQLEYQ